MADEITPKAGLGVFLGRVLAILCILGFIFFYPRIIVHFLGEANPWTSYLYQYGMGLGFFLLGITIILKTGACNLNRQRDRLWFRVLLGGYVFFAVVHAVWILVAHRVPVLGN